MSEQSPIERGRKPRLPQVPAAASPGKKTRSLPGWSRNFINLVRTAIRVPAALYSVYLYLRGYRGYLPDAKIDRAKVERDSIRRVLSQIKAQREQFAREGGRNAAAVGPKVSTSRSDKGRGKRSESRLARPIIYGLGGRGLVTQARLTEMGITPLLLREVPIRDDRSALEIRQKFAAEVKNEIMDDLRSLLEESR